jgi:hypothetical protein
MATLTIHFVKDHFVVTGADIEPMRFKSRREAKDWCRWHHSRLPVVEIGGAGIYGAAKEGRVRCLADRRMAEVQEPGRARCQQFHNESGTKRPLPS